LFNKAKKARKEKEDLLLEEESSKGKMNLYFVISGTIDNPIIKTDKRKSREAFVKEISNEKKDLKKILSEEYGWYRNDTSINNQPVITPPAKKIVEWNDDEDDTSKKEIKKELKEEKKENKEKKREMKEEEKETKKKTDIKVEWDGN
jgi:hypothetical protein